MIKDKLVAIAFLALIIWLSVKAIRAERQQNRRNKP